MLLTESKCNYNVIFYSNYSLDIRLIALAHSLQHLLLHYYKYCLDSNLNVKLKSLDLLTTFQYDPYVLDLWIQIFRKLHSCCVTATNGTTKRRRLPTTRQIIHRKSLLLFDVVWPHSYVILSRVYSDTTLGYENLE